MDPRVARVAVVGGGVAGLSCAQALAVQGVAVTVFDKGRAPGGRLSTRRAPPHAFDLGAQYFTARDSRFVALARAWTEAGVAAPWKGRIVALDGPGGALRSTAPIERFVGTPEMSALARSLTSGLDFRAGHRVEGIAREGGSFVLRGTIAPPGTTLGPLAAGPPGTAELGRHDVVLVCAPSDQAATLLARCSDCSESSDDLASAARAVRVEPCFALGFAAAPDDERELRGLDLDGAFVGREGAASPPLLSWVARDSSKPGRAPGERWVLHASAAFSRAAFDATEPEIVDAMLAAFASTFGVRRPRPAHVSLRRWASARATAPLERGALYDARARLGVAGDWLHGGRIEGAWLSGLELAGRVLGRDLVHDGVAGRAG